MKLYFTTIFTFFLLNLASQEILTDSISEAFVYENRIQTPLSQKAASVTVITRKELQELPGVTVADKLHNVNGLDLRSRGPHGVQTDIGLRGSSFDQVLVLINGIKLNDAQTGHHVMNLPIDLESIDRIEIHFGSAARVFGQNAFAGAINIITKISEDDFIKVKASAGDYNLRNAGLTANIATKNFKQSISGEFNASDGYKFNTDYEIINGLYQSELNLKGHKLNAMLGYTSRKFGANGFYASEDYKDQYEEVTTMLSSLSYSPRLNNTANNILIRGYWRNNLDDYVFLREDPSYFNNIHTNNQYGLEVNSTFKTKYGVLGLGVDAQLVRLESNNLGKRERTVVTGFLEHKFQLVSGKVNITPGVQVNQFSDFGISYLPGVDAAYFVSPKSKIYASVGQTLRVPSYTDLYYSSPANGSNPDLKPETAFSQEIGYSTKLSPKINLDVAIFNRSSSDLIDRIKDTPESVWIPYNISKLRTSGVSSNIAYNSPQFSIVKQVRLGYTYLDSDIEVNEGITSRYALENLRHQLTAGFTLNYTKHLSHTVSYRYADRLNLDSYGLLDSRVNLNIKRNLTWNVFVDVTNILDIDYKETNLVRMPGRWASAGVSYKIGL
ncbi:MAG: TonB-dependent receptor [Flavobacteriales bacterium]